MDTLGSTASGGIMSIMSKIKRLVYWLNLRGAHYIIIRLLSLLQRYGITSTRAEQRIEDCVRQLALYGCHPTFPTPGRVVDKNAEFLRKLQAMGAEIAVHGYHHVDFRSLSSTEARRQFTRASDAFRQSGVQYNGFRCPYLSYTDELLDAIPGDMFRYSSNKAIWWDVVPKDSINRATAIFDSLSRFYRADSSESVISTPRMSRNLLEIPVAVPDDIQLYDGLKLGDQGTIRAWLELLGQIHQRGELFVLMFHPELFDRCMPALESVLTQARNLTPAVWITQLREVSRWWREKSGFRATISSQQSRTHIEFGCSERATVLVRNTPTDARTHDWDGVYKVLEGRTLDLPADQHPFVGLSSDIPEPPRTFIQEQGYIVDSSPQARRCAVYLDSAVLARLNNPVRLVEYIESSPGPLVRFWRWPNAAKSALCLTGDLDALSLIDYASRLFKT
jgi:peptidoglycan/xylan/chitin deacetylase (PgdA/CDA1 family)